MTIQFAYQVVKDLIALAKMKEVDPIDPGTLDARELAAMGIVENANLDAYSWANPQRIFALTEAQGATREVVWVSDTLKRTRRKVVRLTHGGTVDLVLVRKRDETFG
ncbi:MAG: hypothetical protein FJX35_17660 [Alphaproteobacteria bacterium]|nr:hypothetical protein [Alphaproteobacteria bacterium]